MPNLDDSLGAELAAWRADGLDRTLRVVDSAQGPRLVVDGRDLLNFASNDYLGLAADPVLRDAARAALTAYGVGAGASRLVSGNLAPYPALEDRLARFKQGAAALVFPSGYAANVGTIAALVGAGDLVILDKLDHASIIDGARQSGATIRVYPHRNVQKLADLLAQSGRYRRRLIVTESVFSMDGDLAPLAEIVAWKERHDAWLMVDEAHGTGVFGAHGRGLAEEAGVQGRVDITLGTLSKAFGALGGYVVGSETLIHYLRNRARSLVFSTALPPAVCAAAAAAVDLVMSGEGARRRAALWRNVDLLRAGLAQRGAPVPGRSPIVPIIVGDEAAAVARAQALQAQGVFVPAIRYPTVPKGKARLRVSVTAAHTEADVRQLLAALASTGLAS